MMEVEGETQTLREMIRWRILEVKDRLNWCDVNLEMQDVLEVVDELIQYVVERVSEQVLNYLIHARNTLSRESIRATFEYESCDIANAGRLSLIIGKEQIEYLLDCSFTVNQMYQSAL